MGFDSFDISASGLYAQRLRMDTISSNIANINTTRDENGNPSPYVRRQVVFSALYNEALNNQEAKNQDGKQENTEAAAQTDYSGGQADLKGGVSADSPAIAHGVSVFQIAQDKNPYKTVYDPSHPDADQNGFVKKPNINIVTEMVDMMSASRAYEANVSSVEAAKGMISTALRI